MRRSLLQIAGLPLLVSIVAHAAELAGTVVDPGSLVIRQAQVTLTCPGGSQTVTTDGQGRFNFPERPAQRCEIRVTYPGFAPFRRAVRANERPLAIQLAIETRRDAVTVTDRPDQMHPPLSLAGSVSLTAAELKNISNDPKDWIKYARLLAGAGDRPAEVYVDGLPAANLPPPDMIQRIIVNSDSFSAEYADGDYTHIEIITKSPDRHFRFSGGTNSLGIGGRDVLVTGPGAVSRSGNGSLSGSLPHLPITFSLRVSLSYNANPVSVTAILPPAASTLDTTRTGVSTGHMSSVSSSAYYYPLERLRVSFSYSEARTFGTNFGVGGLTLLDSGTSASMNNREGRLSFNGSTKSLLFRGGFVMARAESTSNAHNRNAGLNVLGNFSTGGPAILDSDSIHSAWTLKSVVEPSANATWLLGMTVSGAADSRSDLPNPAGVFTFSDMPAYLDALAGRGTGSLNIMRGDGRLAFRRVNASPFLQKQVVKFRRVLLTGGLRADAQSGVGALVSPRLSAALDWRGFVLRAGGGLFARDIVNDVFVKAIQGDGFHLRPYLAGNAPLAALSPLTFDNAASIRTHLAPDLRLPRQLMEKLSLDRSVRQFMVGLQYTHTQEQRLLGSRRLRDAEGWGDIIESNRSRASNLVHTQLTYAWKKQRLIAFYEWIRSHDNTDGPFSFPEQQNNVRAEWAHSTGVSPHNLTLAGYFSLPAGIVVTLTDMFRGPSPYNITVGKDIMGDGLFNDRGGRPRNSGMAPAYNSLSAYMSRRIPIPKLLGRVQHYAIVGLHGDNLLGNRNYLSVGSVAGAATFGRPLAAMAGRSVRVWLSFD